MAPTSILSRIFFLLSATFQVGGTLKADLSASHIYNPAWPPHAKFHTGQTISMAIVLAGLGLYFAFRPKDKLQGSASGGSLRQPRRDDVWTAMMILDVYWVTQALAFLYPGTHWCDEGFCFDAAFPPQWGVEVVGVGLNALAYGFEAWALSGSGKQMGKKRA